jgi:ubiquinone/menaquinone biosynthesis C-methylase UbiE
MEGIEYFYELYTGLPRGGPGDNKSTRKAFSYLINLPPEPYILDIGCGPGMQTLELAKISKGKIIALDNYQPFLDTLMQNAVKEGLDKHIHPKNQSMLEMDFEDNSFDVIWSEGALYQMGFQNGLKKCSQLLKERGYLAVTEGVLLTSNPKADAREFWEEYPDVKDIQGNITRIQNEKFHLITHFTLPKSSWIDNYYYPMEKRINELKKKYPNNKTALQIFERSEKEIELYKRNSEHVGYEFFVMQKK